MKYYAYNTLRKYNNRMVEIEKLCGCCVEKRMLLPDDRKKIIWVQYGGLCNAATIKIKLPNMKKIERKINVDRFFTNERFLDWGNEGQMQIKSNRLVITICEGNSNDELSLWKEYEFDTAEQFETAVSYFLNENYYIIL